LPADGEKKKARRTSQISGERRRALIFALGNRGVFRALATARELNKHPMWHLSLAGYGLRFRGVASLFGGSAGDGARRGSNGAMSR